MNKYISKQFQDIKAAEFSGAKALFEDTYNFSIGDPDLTTDESIINYAFEKAKEGNTHYGNPSGILELKNAIKEYHKQKYNQNIDIEQIHITNSASHAMYLVLKAILNPDDEVITFAPLFPNYLEQIKINHGKPVVVKTKYEDGFQIRKEDLEAKITSKTKAIIINSPCNPSGVLYNESSFEAIYQVATKYDLLIIADDIYTIFTYNNKTFKSISQYKDLAKRTIILRSFSKDFLMTGWRLGYIIADPCIITVTNFINENVIYSPNIISQHAAIYALKNYITLQKKILDIYSERMNVVYELISKSKYFSCMKPEGTFYIFMNIEKTGMTATEFEKYIYENAHIKVFRGELFGGDEYKYFVRLAINLDVKRIKEAFAKLEALNYKN